MSKKINSSGKYLNTTNLNNCQLQYYGKSILFYKRNFLIIFTFLPILYKKLTINRKFFNITALNVINFNNYICLFLSILELNKFFFQQFRKAFHFIDKKLTHSHFKINLYLEKNYYLSTSFLKNYIFYLNVKRTYPPKKIFNFLTLFLKNFINHSIVSFTQNGPKKKQLLGFRLQLKGRYESTKNSMSKIMTFKVGKVNSTKLNANINFLDYVFYTKLGVSSLKIWLFYKL